MEEFETFCILVMLMLALPLLPALWELVKLVFMLLACIFHCIFYPLTHKSTFKSTWRIREEYDQVMIERDRMRELGYEPPYDPGLEDTRLYLAQELDPSYYDPDFRNPLAYRNMGVDGGIPARP